MFDAFKNPSPKKGLNRVGKEQQQPHLPDLAIVKMMNAPTNTAKQVLHGHVQKVIRSIYPTEP